MSTLCVLVQIWSTVDEDAYLGEMSVIIVCLKQVSMHIIIIYAETEG